MRLLVLFVMLLVVGAAQAADTPVFTFDGKVFRSVEHPEAYVEIGEKISLRNFGRRFSYYEVSAEHHRRSEVYDEHIIYFVKHHDVGFEVWVHDETVFSGYAWTKGIADPHGYQVGDSVVKAIGDTAYCNLIGESTPQLCWAAKDAPIDYVVGTGKKCPYSDTEGRMAVPPCSLIEGFTNPFAALHELYE